MTAATNELSWPATVRGNVHHQSLMGQVFKDAVMMSDAASWNNTPSCLQTCLLGAWPGVEIKGELVAHV